MAMYSMLRRASSSILPLAFGAVASPRSFHGAVSAVRTVGLAERILLPSVRFANSFSAKTSADQNLIRVLETEINCAGEQDHSVEGIPSSFPFTIDSIFFKRQYEDETITVYVEIPNVAPEEENVEDDDEKEENHSDSSIPLAVIVSKGINDPILEFVLDSFPTEISIDSVSIKHPQESEDQLAYEGPDFRDLDENLQKAFYKFLEIRGIKPSTTNFLHNYMVKKEVNEYYLWLKNLKKFIQT